jgi:hypothetical protein
MTQLSFKINGVQMAHIEKDLGQIPVMVKVIFCLINIILLLFMLCNYRCHY